MYRIHHPPLMLTLGASTPHTQVLKARSQLSPQSELPAVGWFTTTAVMVVEMMMVRRLRRWCGSGRGGGGDDGVILVVNCAMKNWRLMSGDEGDGMMVVVRWASVGGQRWMARSLAGSGDGAGKGERGG
ncbi:hypothetical protein Tco_0296569 [Tanacetum coccineum]